MSIPFNEIEMPDKPKTKEQILAEMKRTWKPYKECRDDFSDDTVYLEGFEDVPW